MTEKQPAIVNAGIRKQSILSADLQSLQDTDAVVLSLAQALVTALRQELERRQTGASS